MSGNLALYKDDIALFSVIILFICHACTKFKKCPMIWKENINLVICGPKLSMKVILRMNREICGECVHRGKFYCIDVV